jgi:Cu+-exporting ATPase
MTATAALSMPKDFKLPIEGMTCASCVLRVEKALKALPGVESAAVNLATEEATVRATATVAADALAAAVRKAGYDVPTRRVELQVEGMTCASCVARVEKALLKVPGVSAASVNLATEKASVEALGNVSFATLAAAIDKAGYAAKPVVDAAAPAPARWLPEWWPVALAPCSPCRWSCRCCCNCSASTGCPTAGVQLALATPVQFWLGARFYRAGWKAVKARAGNMDLLVALGTSAAYGLSLYLLLASMRITACRTCTSRLGGRDHAGAAGQVAGDACQAPDGRCHPCAERAAPTVARVLVDGTEVSTPVEQVAVGDVVVIRPGERVPVDGQIIDGRSHVTSR